MFVHEVTKKNIFSHSWCYGASVFWHICLHSSLFTTEVEGVVFIEFTTMDLSINMERSAYSEKSMNSFYWNCFLQWKQWALFCVLFIVTSFCKSANRTFSHGSAFLSQPPRGYRANCNLNTDSFLRPRWWLRGSEDHSYIFTRGINKVTLNLNSLDCCTQPHHQILRTLKWVTYLNPGSCQQGLWASWSLSRQQQFT